MIDPFPVDPPVFLVAAVKDWADFFGLQSLPLHVHEILFAVALYTFVQLAVSPWISRRVCPLTYPRLSPSKRLSWDVHFVSFVQACVINALSLWIIWYDEERQAWRDDAWWEKRVWSYYGVGGLCQSFALGYFLWDMFITAVHVNIFGWGMLAHAISAVLVFTFGYVSSSMPFGRPAGKVVHGLTFCLQRPYVSFYAPVFLLYELSSPFLNIHWFCDKLGLTGSMYQAVNGVLLVSTFFCCRIIWGIYNSICVFRDMYWLILGGHGNLETMGLNGQQQTLTLDELLAVRKDAQWQTEAFNPEHYTPLWIPAVYLVSNLVLNSLNIFWFGKMIETIRTRFDPPLGTKGTARPRHSSEWGCSDGIVIDNKDGTVELTARQSGGGKQKSSLVPADSAVFVSSLPDTRTKIEVNGSHRTAVRSRTRP